MPRKKPSIAGTRITIEYENAQGVVSTRTVNIRWYSGGRGATIRAFCERDQMLKTFRVDRVLELIDAETGEVWDDPKAFFRRFAPSPMSKVDEAEDDVWMDVGRPAPRAPAPIAAPKRARDKVQPPPPVSDDERRVRAEAQAASDREAEAYQVGVLEAVEKKRSRHAARRKIELGLPTATMIVAGLVAAIGGPEAFGTFIAAATFIGTPIVAMFPKLMSVNEATPSRGTVAGTWVGFLLVIVVVLGTVRAVSRAVF